MIKNPGRRSFIKKGLSLLSALALSGCGGGSVSSNTANTTNTTTAPPTAPPVALPSIISHPSDQSILTGESATFQVLAEGPQPFSYQWQRDGVGILGATSPSYTTPSLAAGDDASFSVAVTNDVGTVTSLEAQLTVAKPPLTIDSTATTVDTTLLTVDNV